MERDRFGAKPEAKKISYRVTYKLPREYYYALTECTRFHSTPYIVALAAAYELYEDVTVFGQKYDSEYDELKRRLNILRHHEYDKFVTYIDEDLESDPNDDYDDALTSDYQPQYTQDDIIVGTFELENEDLTELTIRLLREAGLYDRILEVTPPKQKELFLTKNKKNNHYGRAVKLILLRYLCFVNNKKYSLKSEKRVKRNNVVVQCSWCKRYKINERTWDETLYERYEMVSHGICPTCYQDQLDKLNNIPIGSPDPKSD
jgi:hypothetical protein